MENYIFFYGNYDALIEVKYNIDIDDGIAVDIELAVNTKPVNFKTLRRKNKIKLDLIISEEVDKVIKENADNWQIDSAYY